MKIREFLKNVNPENCGRYGFYVNISTPHCPLAFALKEHGYDPVSKKTSDGKKHESHAKACDTYINQYVQNAFLLKWDLLVRSDDIRAQESPWKQFQEAIKFAESIERLEEESEIEV